MTISVVERTEAYRIEEETAFLAIEKALNQYQQTFGNLATEVDISCVKEK